MVDYKKKNSYEKIELKDDVPAEDKEDVQTFKKLYLLSSKIVNLQ